MDAAFWEIATPFTELTARQVFYGAETSRITLNAVMLKLGHPIEDTGCLRCYGDALKRLKRIQKQEMAKRKAKTEKPEYTLRAGIKFAVGQLGRSFQKGEMTQAEARAILRLKPECIENFESYPENWKEDIHG